MSILATPLVIQGLRRWNVLDVPNERSSHRDPTPRGGGLGVAAACLLAILLAPDLGGPVRVGLVVAASGCGLVGLLEDVVGIPALRRLPLLFVAAAAALPWLLEGLDGALGWRVAFTVATLVWLVGYVNAFNFMDGINGIAGGQAAVAGLAWFVAGQSRDLEWLATAGAIVAGAALGFLPHNLPRARVFLGDVGSYFLGAALAAAAVGALRSGLPPEAVLAPLAVFLADTAATLLRRVARGDRWYEAHREHAYQRLATLLGPSHAPVTLLVVAVMAACAGLGLASLSANPAVRAAADAGLVAVVALYLAAPALIGRRRKAPAFA